MSGNAEYTSTTIIVENYYGTAASMDVAEMISKDEHYTEELDI